MNRSRLEKGSALAIMLILAVGVGSVVTTFLGRTLVEQARVAKRAAQVRAYRMAQGQLELAKSIITNAPYVNGTNSAVTTAIAANPPLVAGTGVYVEAAGPDRWYRLSSFSEYNQQTGSAVEFFRDGTPYVSYNYYVENMPLGVSGRPRGKIHTNYGLEFYFPYGYYDDFVSAVQGFSYKNGATVDNTTLAGSSDSAADIKNLLSLIDYSQFQSDAVVVTPPDLTAEVTLLKKNLQIDLYSKPTWVQVPVTTMQQVQTGTTLQLQTVTNYVKVWQWVPVTTTSKMQVPVTIMKKVQTGTTTVDQTVTNYVTVWQWVPVTTTTKVWVPDPISTSSSSSSGSSSNNNATGTDVVSISNPSSSTTSTSNQGPGHYETVSTTTMVYKQVQVADGTSTVTTTVPVYTLMPVTTMQWQTVTTTTLQYKEVNVPNGTTDIWVDVPVYDTVPVTTMQTQYVPGTLQSSTVYPANGIFYVTDAITSLKGDLNGDVTLVSGSSVTITGNVRYVDNNGNTAFLNGNDLTKPYIPNPAFQRDQVLGIVAQGNILYSTNSPKQLEINASLITTGGTVSFQDISVSQTGTLAATGNKAIKDSLRRFGSIMSSLRPVSTMIDQNGNVKAGFKTGASQYDRNLLSRPPPGYPYEQIVHFEPTTDASGAAFTNAGGGALTNATFAALGNLTPLQSLRAIVRPYEFQWDPTVLP